MRVYASLPMTGAAAIDVLRGAQLALEARGGVELVAPDAAGAAARTRFFTAQRAPWGFYGYEAMALILDAIEAGGGDREATVRTARATRDRDSLLGRYSIDDEGLTTAEADGRWAVSGGALLWD